MFVLEHILVACFWFPRYGLHRWRYWISDNHCKSMHFFNVESTTFRAVFLRGLLIWWAYLTRDGIPARRSRPKCGSCSDDRHSKMDSYWQEQCSTSYWYVWRRIRNWNSYQGLLPTSCSSVHKTMLSHKGNVSFYEHGAEDNHWDGCLSVRFFWKKGKTFETEIWLLLRNYN